MSLQAYGIKSNHSEFTVDLIFLVAYAQSFWEIFHIHESKTKVTELEDFSPSTSGKYSNTDTMWLRHRQ